MIFPNGYQEIFTATFGESTWNQYVLEMKSPFVRGLRTNPLRAISQRLELSESVPWSVDGFYLKQTSGIGNDPLHASGCVYLQEPTAMSPVSALQPTPGEKILDLCAAPGGKTTQIGALMQNSGFLLANEPSPSRCNALAENTERLGLTHTAIANADPAKLVPFYLEFFDGILVDAPCSGEGLFRREPDSMKHWSVERLESNAKRQLEILESAYQMLQPGGRLVYSTCTFNPIENEGVCAEFAAKHPDMQLTPLHLPEAIPALSSKQLQESGSKSPIIGERVRSLPSSFVDVPTEHALRYLPVSSSGEGHFVALFIKENVSNPPVNSSPRVNKQKHHRDHNAANAKPLIKQFEQFATDVLSPSFLQSLKSTYTLEVRGSTLYALSHGSKRIHTLMRPGLALLRMEHDHAVPHHALAMAMNSSDTVNELRLMYGDPRILDYLYGQPIPSSTKNGWVWVSLEGAPLGWGKSVNGTLKNHYPKGLRRPYTFAWI